MDMEMKPYDQRPEYNDNYDDYNDYDDNDDNEETEDLESLNNWNPLELDRSVVDIDYSKYNFTGVHRKFEVRKTAQFFENAVFLESECSNPLFIKYLQDKQGFKLVTTGVNKFSIDVEVSYLAPRIVTDELIAVRPARVFKTENGVITDPEEMNIIVGDIRAHYDTFRSEILKRQIKRAGVVGGVIIALAAVVTGLALGLKRKGKDVQRNAEKTKKLVPLKPSKPVEPDVVPWTPLEETNENAIIVVIIVVGLIVLLSTY